MFMFVRLSKKWYAKEFDSLEAAKWEVNEEVNQGNIVAFAEDPEVFADAMNLELGDITLTDDSER